MEKLQVSDQGEIYSYTTVYDAPKGFESMAPYTIALVKPINGPMVTAQLTDLGDGEVQIGMLVEMVTRRLRDDGERALLVYGSKARPILERKSE